MLPDMYRLPGGRRARTWATEGDLVRQNKSPMPYCPLQRRSGAALDAVDAQGRRSSRTIRILSIGCCLVPSSIARYRK
jgi:hypothetical protein